MSASSNQNGRIALLGLAGTLAASFLPGVVYALFAVYVFGQYGEKFGPTGTVLLLAMISGFFTISTAAAYLVGLVPLQRLARVRQPWHAFWLAALASGVSLLSLVTGLSALVARLLDFGPRSQGVYELQATVAILHLIFFSLLCALYPRVVDR